MQASLRAQRGMKSVAQRCTRQQYKDDPVSARLPAGWQYAFIGIGIILGLTGCSKPPTTQLEDVKSSGKLVVLTSNGPTSYYQGPDGPTGPEYDMLKSFADSLKVRLELIVPERTSDILPMLAANQAHMASGMLVTDARKRAARFSKPYQDVRLQVVYRLGTDAPRDVHGLVGRELEVPEASSAADQLLAAKRHYPDLKWTESDRYTAEDLLRMVYKGLLEITIADSNTVSIARQYYPELRVAFSLGEPLPRAWAFPPTADDSLYNLAERHLAKLKRSRTLARLMERYYGPAQGFDYINLTVYQARVRTRLPQYQGLFQEYGNDYGLDWRLLAAIGYQESFWDPSAVSPTGVRGLMMLTNTTAEQLGVEDRIDVAQSISGGARYLRSLIDRMPARIRGRDRVWLALAAYNLGIYHLEDARIITEQRGRDPDRWDDVKQSLPLLAQSKWFKKTKYGYARGLEAVRFVTRVRTYYDVLVKLDQQRQVQTNLRVFSLQAPAI
jgi:membrane-bound lytic murein transglycosylase F